MKKILWIFSFISTQHSFATTPLYWKMAFFENESRTESSSDSGRITQKSKEVQPLLEKGFYNLFHEVKNKYIKFNEKEMDILEAMINKVGLFAEEARSKNPTQPYEETNTEEEGCSYRTSCYTLSPNPEIKTYRLTAKYGTQFTLVTWVSRKKLADTLPLALNDEEEFSEESRSTESHLSSFSHTQELEIL
ncbi:MAG: hypothetical protein BGO07_02165 [Alphaproteobacteria bacterium 40-19]|nr:MAG: hypothetical protein BGO07_02165 [Alphaproteobacteria bacterium 40-19]